MMDQNTCFAYLNMELPDDIRRLKEAGYYDAAIARIDACLAEDWTASQNQPLHPQGALPVNPTPHGVDAWRQGLLAHREILRRLPRDYTLTADQLLNKLQATLRDFTAEEFAALDAAGQMDWRFVEGQKRYIYRAAETLVATHPDLAARQLDPPVPERSWDRFEPQHDQMVRTGAASADITLRTSIGMTDETFARALAAAKAKGRNTVHVKVWLPLPAACPAQSNITLDSFTAQPTYIAPETAPQRTAYWEADLAENCRFGAQYSYRSTAHYAAPLEMQADPVQPDFDTAEQLPLAFPTELYLQNFKDLFAKTDFFTAIWHTVFLTVVSEVLIILVVPLSAYAIERHNSKATKFVYAYFTAGMMIPFHLYMFPLFKEMKVFHIYGTLWGPVICYIAGSVAFGTLLYTSFLKGVPIDIEEAAKIDGCTEFKAFWRVVFPLLGPCTASLVVLNGLGIWNDFLMPYLALPSDQAKTITVAVYSFVGQYTARWDIVFAGTLISLVPALIIYVSLQKYFVKGIMSGAAKG